MWDIFNNDAFSVTSLTDAMREVKYVPSYVGSLGLFESTSVDTLSIAIEKDADNIFKLIPSSPRGGPGATIGKNRGSLRNLTIPHFQTDDAINADEVQGLRAFGTERQLVSIASKIDQRARIHRQSFELTEEYHRLAVITKGQLLDADGSVMYNYFTEMGESQPAEVDWDLDNASPTAGALRQKATDMARAMGATLDGLPMTTIVGICGNAFFDDLVRHKEVMDAYQGWQGALQLHRPTVGFNNPQGGAWARFPLFDIEFVNYRGGLNVGVDTDKCYFVPMGVPNLFRTVYAPADYLETVNTPGQPMYAKQYVAPNGKRVELEFQSNVLHYVTRPRVLMRARRT